MRYSFFRHIPSVVFKRKPIHFTLFVTKRCNAQCPFCFYLKNNSRNGKGPELTIKEISAVADSLGRLLWLSFSGGEVYLREDIVEISRIFYEKCKPSVVLLSTNGLLPERIKETTEEILKSCPKSTIVVKLSLDGDEQIHDSLRGVKDAYQRVMKTYSLLKELLPRYDNFELGINTVFCRANQDHVEDLIEYVKGLDGVLTHTVSLIRGSGMTDVDLKRYQEVSSKLETDLRSRIARRYRFKGADLKAAQDILQRRVIYETVVRNRQIIPCYAGRLSLVMTEEGTLYPCEDFGKPLGNIRKQGYNIMKVLKQDMARKRLNEIKAGQCHCSHECYTMLNILFNPVMFPSLLKEYAKLKLSIL